MSLLTLLIVCSLVAAVAFFLAGLLLASGRGGDAALRKETRGSEALESELEDLRREGAAAKDALAEAKAQRKADEDGRKRGEKRRVAAEEERDRARKEVERLAAKERALAERLRVAEDENRAAFEREEKAAEAWEGQLETTKAERKRQDQTLHREVEELRAQLVREKTEQERLAAESGQSAARAAEAAAALDDLRQQSQRQVQERAEAIEAERSRLVKAAEEAAAREQDALKRLGEVEAAGLAKAAAVEESLRARLAQAEAERTKLAEQLERGQAEREAGQEERLSLSLRVRAAEEVAEQRKAEVLAVIEPLRSAEARLKDLERLAQENAELREQRARAEQEARQQAGRDDEVKDAKVELAAAQAKLAELERTLEENRRLRDEVAELRTHEGASGELERLTAVHKQVRLDAELMARRLQELLHDQAELGPLRAQAAEAALFAEEVEYLRRREKDLEAQLYASGSYASREMPAVTGEIPVVAPASDMETNLNALVGEGGPRTAVLADAQGFLIAGAGESVAQEGLAAFAAVAGEMVSRARMLLPLAEVNSVRVTDANKMVLTCHLFDSAGEGLGVATLGPGEPKAENTARAIAGLAAIVSGAEDAADKTPEPAT
jgi:hypothetical protein